MKMKSLPERKSKGMKGLLDGLPEGTKGFLGGMWKRGSGRLPSIAVCCLFLSGPGTLQAQDYIHGGAHVSYGTEDFSELGVGVHGTYLLSDYLAGAASFTYHFPGGDVNFWDLNLNGHYLFQIEGELIPYVGAGLNYSRISFDIPDVGFGDTASSSEIGLNVLGGAFMNLGDVLRVFGEGRYVISDFDQLLLTFGFSLPMGS